jgi:signal transduction histidine kinase
VTRGDRLTRGAQLVVLGVGLLVGVGSVAIVRRSPGYSLAGSTGTAVALELAAGGLLVCCGAVAIGRPAQRPFAILITCAGLAWFVQEWNNPGAGSAVVFTAGLLLSTVCPVLVAHAALLFQHRQVSPVEKSVLGAAYASTLVVAGLLTAAFDDPRAAGCSACPANLVAVGNDRLSARWLLPVSEWAGVGWAVALAVLVLIRLTGSSAPQRRMFGPLQAVAVAYLSCVALQYLHLRRTGQSIDDTDHRLWAAQGILLVALALASWWPDLRSRMVRARVARLVADLARLTPAGGLSASLGLMFHDPDLRLLYPLDDGRLTDGAGHPAQPGEGQATTTLAQGDRVVAVLAHRPRLLDEPGVAAEIVAAAGIALDNERLQAETGAQLADLRASRSRVVAASDAARRQLERDLHDGAQQKLVTLSLGLRLAGLRAAAQADDHRSDRLDAALSQATQALTELRVLARGLHPRELADEGLAAGLETLAETSPTPIQLTELVEDRLSPEVESAAFFAVARLVRGSQWASVQTSVHEGMLVVETSTDTPPVTTMDIEDRVGALDGTLSIDRDGAGRTRVRVVLPCG